MPGFPALLNFRASTAYVTDAAGETPCRDPSNTTPGVGDLYPTTRNGLTFGYTTNGGSIGSRDQNASYVELAGAHFNETANLVTFQLDLPAAGQYDIRLASGYYTAGFATTVKVYDDTTLLFTVSGTTSGGDKYLDADSVERTGAAWQAGTNTAKRVTFATTTLIVKIGDNAGTATGFLNALQVTAVAAAASSGVVVVRTVPGGTGGTMTVTRTAP